MKVLFSHDIFVAQAHGGASRMFVGLHRQLLAQGIDSRIAAGLHINVYLDGQPGVAGANLWADAPVAVRRAAGVCNTAMERVTAALWRPSVYHLTYYPRRTEVPPGLVAVTVLDMIHELYPEQFPHGDRTSDRKRRWVDAADVVFAISERTREDLISLFSVPADKVVAAHPGVTPLVPDPSFDAGRFGDYLLYVGERGMGYKNFDGLVRALVRSEAARSLNLVCFGGRATDQAEQRMLADAGILGRTTMVTGGDPQLAALYAGARALVYPSKYEGFGFPPLEAMSAGCPVACARAGSLPEVVGDAALLFDPCDEDDMSGAIDRIVTDEALRRRLVDAGAQRVGKFTWERAGTRTIEGYQSAGQVASAADG